MKTKVEKIETKVKMTLWGSHWVFTPMLLIVASLWITGNSDALKEGNFWYVLIVGLFGSIVRISKIPAISILLLIALIILNAFDSFTPKEATVITSLFVIIGMIYDHFLLRKEVKSRILSNNEKQDYLDLVKEEVNKSISYLYDRIEYYNTKLSKLEISLLHEQKEFEDAKKFSGSTINFEKSIQRKGINIKGINDILSKDKVTIKELELALEDICNEQKGMQSV